MKSAVFSGNSRKKPHGAKTRKNRSKGLSVGGILLGESKNQIKPQFCGFFWGERLEEAEGGKLRHLEGEGR